MTIQEKCDVLLAQFFTLRRLAESAEKDQKAADALASQYTVEQNRVQVLMQSAASPIKDHLTELHGLMEAFQPSFTSKKIGSYSENLQLIIDKVKVVSVAAEVSGPAAAEETNDHGFMDHFQRINFLLTDPVSKLGSAAGTILDRFIAHAKKYTQDHTIQAMPCSAPVSEPAGKDEADAKKGDSEWCNTVDTMVSSGEMANVVDLVTASLEGIDDATLIAIVKILRPQRLDHAKKIANLLRNATLKAQWLAKLQPQAGEIPIQLQPAVEDLLSCIPQISNEKFRTQLMHKFIAEIRQLQEQSGKQAPRRPANPSAAPQVTAKPLSETDMDAQVKSARDLFSGLNVVDALKILEQLPSCSGKTVLLTEMQTQMKELFPDEILLARIATMLQAEVKEKEAAAHRPASGTAAEAAPPPKSGAAAASGVAGAAAAAAAAPAPRPAPPKAPVQLAELPKSALNSFILSLLKPGSGNVADALAALAKEDAALAEACGKEKDLPNADQLRGKQQVIMSKVAECYGWLNQYLGQDSANSDLKAKAKFLAKQLHAFITFAKKEVKDPAIDALVAPSDADIKETDEERFVSETKRNISNVDLAKLMGKKDLSDQGRYEIIRASIMAKNYTLAWLLTAQLKDDLQKLRMESLLHSGTQLTDLCATWDNCLKGVQKDIAALSHDCSKVVFCRFVIDQIKLMHARVQTAIEVANKEDELNEAANANALELLNPLLDKSDVDAVCKFLERCKGNLQKFLSYYALQWYALRDRKKDAQKINSNLHFDDTFNKVCSAYIDTQRDLAQEKIRDKIVQLKSIFTNFVQSLAKEEAAKRSGMIASMNRFLKQQSKSYLDHYCAACVSASAASQHTAEANSKADVEDISEAIGACIVAGETDQAVEIIKSKKRTDEVLTKCGVMFLERNLSSNVIDILGLMQDNRALYKMFVLNIAANKQRPNGEAERNLDVAIRQIEQDILALDDPNSRAVAFRMLYTMLEAIQEIPTPL